MSWPTVTLSECGEVQGGLQVSRKRQSLPIQRPYLRVANVYRDRLDLSEVKKIQTTELEATRTRLQQGDLLFVEGHANPNEVGRVALWDGSIADCLHQNHLIRVRLDPSVLLPAFAVKWFNSPAGASHFRRAGKTTSGLNTISASTVRSAPTPLPSITEQRRIAAVLDRANDLRAKQLAAQSTLEGLVDSIFLEMFGDPATQNRFESTALGDLVDFYSGGTPSKSKPEYWDGQLPWFSPKDLKKPYLWDSADHISEDVPNETAIRKLPADTVVLVVRGMILAHTVPVSLIRVPATVNQDLKALLPRNPVSPLFLQTALRVQHQRILGLVSTAAHGTKKLETQSLREVRIPRPGHLAEEQFSRRVRQSGFLSDELTQVTGELDLLFNSIQSRAFSGQL